MNAGRGSALGTPLHLASAGDALTLLLRAGADVEAVDSAGQTPLIYSAVFDRAQTVAALVAAGAVRRSRLAGSGRRAISTSRLNSAAPYNTHAWPPINRWSTRCFLIVERALRIGLGIKRPSHRNEVVPEPGAFVPALLGRHAIPVDPFRLPDLVDLDHPCEWYQSGLHLALRLVTSH